MITFNGTSHCNVLSNNMFNPSIKSSFMLCTWRDSRLFYVNRVSTWSTHRCCHGSCQQVPLPARQCSIDSMCHCTLRQVPWWCPALSDWQPRWLSQGSHIPGQSSTDGPPVSHSHHQWAPSAPSTRHSTRNAFWTIWRHITWLKTSVNCFASRF